VGAPADRAAAGCGVVCRLTAVLAGANGASDEVLRVVAEGDAA
jgi:hypothetical protein